MEAEGEVWAGPSGARPLGRRGPDFLLSRRTEHHTVRKEQRLGWGPKFQAWNSKFIHHLLVSSRVRWGQCPSEL